MKIYIVCDHNENLKTIFFSTKKKALKYYNHTKKNNFMEFKTIDVKANKKGIIRAMQHGCNAVGSDSGDENDNQE